MNSAHHALRPAHLQSATMPSGATGMQGRLSGDPGLRPGYVPDRHAAAVRVIGELDLATAPQLREVFADLTGQGTVYVTVDLSEMAFIDSTGVTVLVSGLKRLHDAGGDMALVSPRALP